MNALSRTRRWRKVAFGLILTGTLLALFYAAVDWYAARQWATCQRSLRARGEILDLSTLEGPPISPARNLALLPFFTHWGSYRVDASTGRTVFLEDSPLPLYFRPLPSLSRAAMRQDYPGSENFDLPAWQHHFQHEHPEQTEPDPARAVLQALEPVRPMLDTLAAAQRAMPDGVFREEYATGGWPVHPEFVLSITLALRATASLAAGQAHEAWQDIDTVLWLRRACCGDPPVLLPMMLGSALAHECYVPVKNGLAADAWNPEEIARLQDELARIDLLADYRCAIRGERAWALSKLDQTWPRPFFTHILPLSGDGWEQRLFFLAADYGPRACLDINKTALGRCYQDLLGACDPSAHRIYPQRQAVLDRRAQDSPSLRHFGSYVLSSLGYSVGPQLSVAADEQTRVDELVVRCALARYRLAHAGQSPATLGELIPRYLDHVPGGIRDGLPMRYQPLPDGRYQLAAEVAR